MHRPDNNHIADREARRDRKYYVSLALHEAVGRHLRLDPDRVVRLGIQGASRVLPHTRGSARDLTQEWLALLEARDLESVGALLTGEDEHAVEMRNVTVFLGVLSETERRATLDGVYARGNFED